MSESKAFRRDSSLVWDRQLSEKHANIESQRIAAQSDHDGLQRQNIDSRRTFEPVPAEHLQNILNISKIPLLVIDGGLNLVSFTLAVTALFDVTASDLGRPFAEITRRFAAEDILLDAQTVIANRMPISYGINTDNGAYFKLSLLPYCVEDNEVQSLVMVFADISERKVAEREFETAQAFYNSVIDTIHESLVVLDEDLCIISATPRFYRSFAVKPEDAVGKSLPDLPGCCLDVPAVRIFLDHIVAGDDVADDYKIEIAFPRRGRRILILNARSILVMPPEKKKIMLAIDDITDGERTVRDRTA